MKTRPVTRRRVEPDEIRARLAEFEAANPGIGRHNYADAFRDADGELIETPEFFEISGMYSFLAASDG